MTDESEISDNAVVALRRLAGSLGAIALSDGANELVSRGYAQPIGSGFAITARGAAAVREPAPFEPEASDESSQAEDPAQEERLF